MAQLISWRAAGLFVPTASRTVLITLPCEDVIAVVGHLRERDWTEAQGRLRLAMAI